MNPARQSILQSIPQTLRITSGVHRIPVLVLCCLLLSAAASAADRADLDTLAHSFTPLANQSRAQAGLAPLQWDPALAAAAHAHAVRMAAEGPIAHRYGGEPSLAERTSAAGAHFSLVEENIAIGDSPQQIHTLWMHSPEHRANLLDPTIDRIGVGLVAARGVLYAVADYSRSVRTLSLADQEAEVAHLFAPLHLPVSASPAALAQARSACAASSGIPSADGLQPLFVMRWQSGSLANLPQPLIQRIQSGHFTSAAVGACAPHLAPTQEQASFTAYRIAVLLY